MATLCGHLDAQNPAIITISAVQTAIKYLKGHKIMIRNQNTINKRTTEYNLPKPVKQVEKHRTKNKYNKPALGPIAEQSS